MQTSRCNVAAVTEAQKGTQADRQLGDALAEQGLDATFTQFKRWRAAGVLASPVQHSAGRGKGRPSERYPVEAVEQAAAILKLLSFGVPLKHMAIAMLVRGAPVTEEAIQESFLDFLAEPPSNLDDDERADRADQMGAHLQRRARRNPLLHHWSDRARGHGEPGRFVLSDMLSALMQLIVTGTRPSTQAETATSHILGLGPDQTAELCRVMNDLTPGVLRATARDVTLTELFCARQTLSEWFKDAPPGSAKPNFGTAGVMLLALAALARRKYDS